MTKKVLPKKQNKKVKLPSFSKVEDSGSTMLFLKEIGRKAAKSAVDEIKKAGLLRVYLDEGESKIGSLRTYRKISRIVKVSPSNKIVSIITTKPRTKYFVKCDEPIPLNVNRALKNLTTPKEQFKLERNKGAAIGAKITIKKSRKPIAILIKTPNLSAVKGTLIGAKPEILTKSVKKLWVYVKANKRLKSKSKRIINSNIKLKPVYEVKPKVMSIDNSTQGNKG